MVTPAPGRPAPVGRRTRPRSADGARAAGGLDGWWYAGGMLFLLAMLVYVVGWFRGDETDRGLILGPFFALLFVPVFVQLRKNEPRWDLGGILFAAFSTKLVTTYARYWMVEELYGGAGDSADYNFWGRLLASDYRALDFSSTDGAGPIPGTGYLRMLTGIVYSIFGADFFGGYIVFSMLSFLGCWAFLKAFRIALPDVDPRRYAVLVLFWPTLLFWPAAIGKDAWMVFSLGIASLGASALYARRLWGLPVLALGITAAAMPRPHIAIVVLAAAGAGLFMASVFGARAGGRKVGIGTKVVGVGFLLVAASILAPQVSKFLQIDDVDGSGFSASLEEVNDRTSQGGSEYDAPEIRSPLDYPWAFVTVLFRPFPYEVASAATAVSALEGLLLLGLVVWSAPRLVRLPIALMRNAYIAYAASFAFMFGYVFSFVANFGILARQRAQMLPFFLVLLALPLARELRSGSVDEDEGAGLDTSSNASPAGRHDTSPAAPRYARRPVRGRGVGLPAPRNPVGIIAPPRRRA